MKKTSMHTLTIDWKYFTLGVICSLVVIFIISKYVVGFGNIYEFVYEKNTKFNQFIISDSDLSIFQDGKEVISISKGAYINPSKKNLLKMELLCEANRDEFTNIFENKKIFKEVK